MASIGVVNADSPNKQEPAESTIRPKEIFFGVFFDGTDNNMIQKETARRFREKNSKKGDDWEAEVITINDETFKNGANQLHVQGKDYSNVAILHSVYRAMSEDLLNTKRQTKDITIYNIYIEGPGRDTDQNARIKGLGFGTGKYGVCSMVSKAVNIIRQRINAIPQHELPNTNIHFDVFGFSRGATGARLFSYLALRKNGQKLGCESEFKEYSAAKYFDGNFLHFLDTMNLNTVTVDFLGIFDTVSSIGGVTVDSYIHNTTDYGLYSPILDNVLNTFHLCAMDEFREHFALTDIGKAVDKNSNAEIFIPGCHADVGGGYTTGSDEFELSSTLNPTLSFPSDKIENKPKNTLPLSQKTLEKMGWISSTSEKAKETLERRSVNVEVNRIVPCGYSNIPLAMMRKRSVQKNARQTFAQIPPSYQINEKIFGTWSKIMMELAKEAKGRSFYYPGGSYTSSSYAKLRNFLHFSASDTIGKTFTGGLPTYNPATMLYSRFLYKGNINDCTRLYMYQYYL